MSVVATKRDEGTDRYAFVDFALDLCKRHSSLHRVQMVDSRGGAQCQVQAARVIADSRNTPSAARCSRAAGTRVHLGSGSPGGRQFSYQLALSKGWRRLEMALHAHGHGDPTQAFTLLAFHVETDLRLEPYAAIECPFRVIFIDKSCSKVCDWCHPRH